MDDFLAEAFASLPVSRKPWVCALDGERFATLAEINEHLNTEHEEEE